MRHECWCVECPSYAAAGVTLRESETFVRDVQCARDPARRKRA